MSLPMHGPDVNGVASIGSTSPPYSGDFALLNPFPVLRDEDGMYHCPLPILQTTFESDDQEEPTRVRALCGEELRVEWHLSCPVPDHDARKPSDRLIRSEDASTWAFESWWELKCSNGHVLMTSADAYGSDESAHPFDTAAVFGLDGATVPGDGRG